MEDNAFIRAVSDGGYAWAYLLAFGYGVLTSLTPCVYPMIGITVSIFGARKVERRLDGFLLSGAFVLGIAVTFSVLGLVAGLGGMVFGGLLANRWVVIGLAAMLAAPALSMFGAYEIRLPASWQTRLAGVGGGGGRLGAFAMGLVGGIIAAPCTGPFLLGILAYIGAAGSPALGVTFLFVYALGIGLLFLVVGTFAVSLPKSGPWMDAVKTFLGCVLLATAAWFLVIPFPAIGSVFRSGLPWLVAAAALAAAGAVFGAMRSPFRGGGAALAVRKAAGIAAMSAGLFGFASSLSWAEPLDWIDGIPAAEARARAERRALLVDFTARWCSHCKEIERDILADREVRRAMKDVLAARVDLSTDADAAEGGEFRIHGRTMTLRGLPRVLLFDPSGELVRDWGGADPHLDTPARLIEALRSIRSRSDRQGNGNRSGSGGTLP